MRPIERIHNYNLGVFAACTKTAVREIQEAALLAGIQIREVVEEPVAVSLSHASPLRIPNHSYIVVNVGGSMCDASLLTLDDHNDVRYHLHILW